MTYSINAVARRIVLSGSAGTGPYDFTFEILANTDVAVFLDTTLLTLSTDYSVTINANGTGRVTLNTGTTNVPNAPTNANTVTVVGSRAIARTTDFVTAGDLKASSLNEQLDSLTIFDQQISERVDRALIGNISDPLNLAMALPKATDRAGKFLAFDSTGATIAQTQGSWQGNWSSGRSYASGDIIKDTSTGSIFIANTAHTSSGSQPITSNADAAKWDQMIDVSTVTTAETNAGNSATAAGDSATAAAASATAAAFSDDWAVKTTGIVDDGTTQDYSSKAYAIGGNGVTDGAGLGPAKDWAIETTGQVDGTEYSSKEYAIGVQRRGQANGGSAKDWATYVDGTNTVDGTSFSAKYWATKAEEHKTEFSNLYHGSSSTAPTGSEVGVGDLWFDSANNALKYYNASNQWIAIQAVDTSTFATKGFSIALAIAL